MATGYGVVGAGGDVEIDARGNKEPVYDNDKKTRETWTMKP